MGSEMCIRDRHWGLDEHALAVLYVGRLAAEKNLRVVVDAFNAIAARRPDAKLVFVGDGPMTEKLKQQCPQAVFCGSRRGEDLAAHYASGDLFLFPSLTETFGNVVLEAMASGLAVVAYDEAAAAQHIRHGHSGALAMPGDQVAFIDAACWLLEESETLRRVRLNARQHASRQGWPAIIEQFETHLYSACLAEPAGTEPARTALAVKPRSTAPRG